MSCPPCGRWRACCGSRARSREPPADMRRARHQWRGLIEEYRAAPAGDRRHARSSRCARAARRSCASTPLSEETGCDVWLKYDGANPTGSFKDRGMTLAISKAVEEGAKAVVCASTGNTSRQRRRLRGQGRPHVRGAGPQGQGRPGQDGADPRARRPGAGGRGQLRRVPGAGQGPGRALPGHAREQREPVPAAGSEDRGVRDLRRAGPCAGPALRAGRQRRQHLQLLDGLLRVPRRRRDPRAAADVRLPGAGRGAHRARRGR